MGGSFHHVEPDGALQLDGGGVGNLWVTKSNNDDDDIKHKMCEKEERYSSIEYTTRTFSTARMSSGTTDTQTQNNTVPHNIA